MERIINICFGRYGHHGNLKITAGKVRHTMVVNVLHEYCRFLTDEPERTGLAEAGGALRLDLQMYILVEKHKSTINTNQCGKFRAASVSPLMAEVYR